MRTRMKKNREKRKMQRAHESEIDSNSIGQLDGEKLPNQ